MLVLDRVGKTYPNGVHAVAGVSLGVELGEVVALIGGSGCGKSTLLRGDRNNRDQGLDIRDQISGIRYQASDSNRDPGSDIRHRTVTGTLIADT
jgi:ABC-type phosphate/phosphonate transport system ATPase subunit